MIAHESKSAIVFRHWVRANGKDFVTSAIETKDTRGKSYLNFSEVSEAQIRWLLAIKTSENGVLLRIIPIAEGMPDYIFLKKESAFIPIKYPKKIELIDIETFILEKKRTKEKSLTSQRAHEISILTINL